LKQCRSGDVAALQRMRAELPRLAELNDERAAFEIRLADIQHALARERGYANWGELKRLDQKMVLPDYSKPGADGTLPEGFRPWSWCVAYTIRPEAWSPLVYSHEYKIFVSVLRKAAESEPFTGYAAL
jgi:hypothetical protein